MFRGSKYSQGLILVLGSAVVWSFGGVLARFLVVQDSWAIVFWRSIWGALFLIGFLLVRDGLGSTLRNFRRMRLPAIVVALCFCVASISFVVALKFTTVANILLVQATVPLIASSMAWLAFGESVSRNTWIAIALVICGVAVMVSGSFDGSISSVGDSLAILIAVAFATATVITRRYSDIPMVPAVGLGIVIAAVFAFSQVSSFVVLPLDMVVLFSFGALNLGLGLALFAVGARLIPASISALIGTAEPVLGPLWVWIVHGETPSLRTLTGGAIVMVALVLNSIYELKFTNEPTQ
jgi:drug/metabolite transporter (DMT)-like permease